MEALWPRQGANEAWSKLFWAVTATILAKIIVAIFRRLVQTFWPPLQLIVLKATEPLPAHPAIVFWVLFLSALVYAGAMVVFYSYRLARVPPVREVTKRSESVYTWVDYVFLYRVFHTSRRQLLGAAILVIALVLVFAGPYVPPFFLYCLVLLVMWNAMREFYLRHAYTGTQVRFLIDQLLLSLGRHWEHSLRDALDDESCEVRCQLMLFDPGTGKLVLRHGYNAGEEPVWADPTKGLLGLVLADGDRRMRNPYRAEELGYGQEECEELRGIAWRAVFALKRLGNGKPYGVVSIDSDRKVPQRWLDKMQDFSHAKAKSIATIYNSEYNGNRALVS